MSKKRMIKKNKFRIERPAYFLFSILSGGPSSPPFFIFFFFHSMLVSSDWFAGTILVPYGTNVFW